MMNSSRLRLGPARDSRYEKQKSMDIERNRQVDMTYIGHLHKILHQQPSISIVQGTERTRTDLFFVCARRNS